MIEAAHALSLFLSRHGIDPASVRVQLTFADSRTLNEFKSAVTQDLTPQRQSQYIFKDKVIFGGGRPSLADFKVCGVAFTTTHLPEYRV